LGVFLVSAEVDTEPVTALLNEIACNSFAGWNNTIARIKKTKTSLLLIKQRKIFIIKHCLSNG
jgi:hypothetical protein